MDTVISIVAIILPLIPGIVFLVCMWKFGKQTKYDGDDFRGITGNKGGGKIAEIDKLYRDKEKVKELILNNSLFKRKSVLLFTVQNGEHKKEYWLLLGASILDAMLSLALSMEFLNIQGSVGNLLKSFMLSLMACIVCTIMYVILTATGTDETLACKYELSYIDKAIEEHMRKNTSPKKRFCRFSRISSIQIREKEKLSNEAVSYLDPCKALSQETIIRIEVPSTITEVSPL